MLFNSQQFEEAKKIFEASMMQMQEVERHMKSQGMLVEHLTKELTLAKAENETLKKELRELQEQKSDNPLSAQLSREKEINAALLQEIQTLRHVIPPPTKSPISRVRALEKAIEPDEINKSDSISSPTSSKSSRSGKGPLRLGRGSSHLFTEEITSSPKAYEPSSRATKQSSTPKPEV